MKGKRDLAERHKIIDEKPQQLSAMLAKVQNDILSDKEGSVRRE